MQRQERRAWQACGMSAKGSEAGQLVFEEWKVGRKLGQELSSHLKEEKTEGWRVGATSRPHRKLECSKVNRHTQLDCDVVNGFPSSLSESSLSEMGSKPRARPLPRGYSPRKANLHVPGPHLLSCSSRWHSAWAPWKRGRAGRCGQAARTQESMRESGHETMG